MRETPKASRWNKAEVRGQTIEDKKRLKDSGKDGVATVPKFPQPSVIRHPSSDVCRQTTERLFLPFDFLKICVHHIIVSRFR
jgi:hypothetical protein